MFEQQPQQDPFGISPERGVKSSFEANKELLKGSLVEEVLRDAHLEKSEEFKETARKALFVKAEELRQMGKDEEAIKMVLKDELDRLSKF
ncbi:MAG: hypothetical protein BMS9Abin13_366 [Patescibacteria group bacterium]|nr:MAG: hypothetical protein BMS9Abin13_366 [Patescibacteria group bacterium]